MDAMLHASMTMKRKYVALILVLSVRFGYGIRIADVRAGIFVVDFPIELRKFYRENCP